MGLVAEGWLNFWDAEIFNMKWEANVLTNAYYNIVVIEVLV